MDLKEIRKILAIFKTNNAHTKVRIKKFVSSPAKLFSSILIIVSSISVSAFAQPTAAEKKFYRDLVLKIRPQAEFKVPMPANGDMHFDYKLEFDQPEWPEPNVGEFSVTDSSMRSTGKFYRIFFDKIFLKEGSYMAVAGEQIPLTCIHVEGQDNRFSGNPDPRFPQLILKIIFVANDWTCQGPINPGWPETGGKEQAWETNIHYEVRDPTIMLPVESGLRYRWNEYNSVLVK